MVRTLLASGVDVCFANPGGLICLGLSAAVAAAVGVTAVGRSAVPMLDVVCQGGLTAAVPILKNLHQRTA